MSQGSSQSPHAALVAAIAETSNVTANKILKTDKFSAKYVTLDVLFDMVKPILCKHGLAMVQSLITEDGRVGVSTSIIHVGGTSFDFGKLMMKADGLTPQQVGSLLTYARRQSLVTALGIAVDKDDDASAISRSAPRSAPAAAPGPWYGFLSDDKKPLALSYLKAIKWLSDGQSLSDLPEGKVDSITKNQDAFLKAISSNVR